MHEEDVALMALDHLLLESHGVHRVIADLPSGCGLAQDTGQHRVSVRHGKECGDPLSDAGGEEFVVAHGVVLKGFASPQITLADVVDLAAGAAPEFNNDNLVPNIDVLLLGDAGTGVEGILLENFHGLEDLGIDSRVHGVD
jgi:hypothetical protein